MSDSRGFSRRQILGIGGGMAAASLLGASACGSGDSGGKKRLQLGTFASISSQFPIFEKLIKDYQKEHPDVTIRIQPMPADSFQTQLDTRLAAGNAPDIVYMQHVSVGRYAEAGALVDLTEHLGGRYADAFPEAFWRVVLHDDKVFGIRTRRTRSSSTTTRSTSRTPGSATSRPASTTPGPGRSSSTSPSGSSPRA